MHGDAGIAPCHTLQEAAAHLLAANDYIFACYNGSERPLTDQEMGTLETLKQAR